MNFNSKKIDHFTFNKEQLIEFCSVFSQEEGTCLFFSGGSFDMSKMSYLCLFPLESLWVHKKIIYHLKRGSRIPEKILCENPWDGLKSIVSIEDCASDVIPDWIGYLGYEMGSFADSEKEIPYQPSNIPDAYFIRSAAVLAVHHLTGELFLHIREASLPLLSENQKDLLQSISTAEGIHHILENIQHEVIVPSLTNASILCTESREEYYTKIEQAKELIRSGEIYQVNLSQKLCFDGIIPPYKIFQKVATINPAPFMGFFNFPGFILVSSSPERFLCKKGEALETRPIKGTISRGKDSKSDLLNRNELLNSIKDKAELLMITDLMRNDLGKVSCAGSVVTEKIWHCEAYANVFHLNSIIHSKSKPHLHPVDIIRTTFPAGSITGCPKLRAMEVIYDLEKRPRGIYTGSIGYFATNGDFDFNVAIRTILFKDDLIDISLGGAIVSDSIPEKEYEETLHKGASLFKSLQHEETVGTVEKV